MEAGRPFVEWVTRQQEVIHLKGLIMTRVITLEMLNGRHIKNKTETIGVIVSSRFEAKRWC